MIRRLVNGLVLVALLIAAGLVIHTTPTDGERDAPIYVTGSLGDELAGRNIAATVNDVRLARTVSTPNWTGETAGVWVVVDASASAVENENGALLVATLVIGNRTFSASERPDLETIARRSLFVGIPIGGPLFFEVPKWAVASDAARSARLQFTHTSDARGDSMLEVTTDLTTLDVEESIATDATTWGGRS